MKIRILTISAILLVWFASPLSAQVDFRNSDRGRPILIEDAYPVEFLGFELQGGLRYERDRGDGQLDVTPELRFGAYKNLQIGIETDYISMQDNNRRSGLSDTLIHAFYNFNQEGLSLPAIAIRFDGGIPTGGLGSDHLHFTPTAIATKGIGDLRSHINISYTLGPTSSPGRGGEISRYFYGLGLDYTWPLKFLMVMGDIVVQKPIDDRERELLLEFGARMQIHPKWVLDIGIGTEALKEEGADFFLTTGLTYIFGVRKISLQRLDK